MRKSNPDEYTRESEDPWHGAAKFNSNAFSWLYRSSISPASFLYRMFGILFLLFSSFRLLSHTHSISRIKSLVPTRDIPSRVSIDYWISVARLSRVATTRALSSLFASLNSIPRDHSKSRLFRGIERRVRPLFSSIKRDDNAIIRHNVKIEILEI